MTLKIIIVLKIYGQRLVLITGSLICVYIHHRVEETKNFTLMVKCLDSHLIYSQYDQEKLQPMPVKIKVLSQHNL